MALYIIKPHSVFNQSSINIKSIQKKATVEDDFSYKGPLGKITFYKMKGVNKLVARSVNGSTGGQIKNGSAFAGMRKIMVKWKDLVKGL